MQNPMGMYEYAKQRQTEFLAEAARVRMLEQARENGRVYRSAAAAEVVTSVRHQPSSRPRLGQRMAALYCRLASFLF